MKYKSPDGYISRAKFMQPILDKMHEQQRKWKEMSISALQEAEEKSK